MTKTKIPPTHAEIAIKDLFVGRWPLIWALSTVVMTSAMAPSGWTTMRGAKDSAPSWHRIARPSITVPTTHDGRVSSRPSCGPVRPCEAEPLIFSTLVTPRCWYCAPNDMKTAPSRASGMPIRIFGFWNAPTSWSLTSWNSFAIHTTSRH